MAKRKKVDNDLQSTTQKTKDWVLSTGGELRCSGRSSCSTSGTRRVTPITHPLKTPPLTL